MNRELVDKLARALLYEGYVLYPYRPSVKNTQRWTFGGIYPQAWSDAQTGTDAACMQTQCLVAGTGRIRVRIVVRFLHLMDRKVGELDVPVYEVSINSDPAFHPVMTLTAGGHTYQSWQEAEEREIDLGEFEIAGLMDGSCRRTFQFTGSRSLEPIRADDGLITAVLVREQQVVSGVIDVAADRLTDELFKLSIRISNETNLGDVSSRDLALMHSLISTHTILGVEAGEFVSLTDPPEKWKAKAAGCKNISTWPVLVGNSLQRDTILSSPIILGDYPQLAPESPGELFDSTEIDEILTLRILTLTDEEKQAAAGVDDRVRDLLRRTESLAREQLINLHGTVRGLRPVPMEQSHD